MTVDELKKYVTTNKRICPMPLVWNNFLDILGIKEKMPPHLIPLILNGWFSSDLEKRKRVLAQIEYASKNKDCTRYARNIRSMLFRQFIRKVTFHQSYSYEEFEKNS